MRAARIPGVEYYSNRHAPHAEALQPELALRQGELSAPLTPAERAADALRSWALALEVLRHRGDRP